MTDVESANGEHFIERLLIELGDGASRAAGRRAFRQAAASTDDPSAWWNVVVDCLVSVGKKGKAVVVALSEALAMLEQGAAIVVRTEGDSPRWLGLLGSRKGVRLIDDGQDAAMTPLSRRQTAQVLKDAGFETGTFRCVVIDVGFGRIPGQPESVTKLKPLRRLQALLRPEFSDIVTVCIYALIVGLLTMATPIAVEALVNTVAFGRFLQPVVVLALLLFTFLAFAAAIRAVQTVVVEIIQRRLFARVAGDLAYRLPRVRVQEFDGSYAPENVNRFFDVVTVQKVSAQLLLEGLGLVLSALVGMTVLGFYHPWLAGFDIMLIAMIVLVVFVMGRGAVDSSVVESKKKYMMAGWLEDIARCPVAFRTDGGAEFAMERADRVIHDYLSARRTHFRILMRQVLSALGLQAIASTALLGIGGWLVVSGELTLGQLVAAELIVAVIVGSVAKLGKHMESFYDLLAAVDKLGLLFDLETEPTEGTIQANGSGPASVELARLKCCPQSRTLNENIAPSELVAVRGNAGAGKSRLLDVLYGLRRPVSGHLTIDDSDPRDLRPDVLRGRVALARDVEFFDGSIAENVHLGRASVTPQAVNNTLDRLGLLDELLALPDGLNTRLPSGGGELSSGQLRRLMLARAMVGRPGLLLVDGLLDGFSDDELTEVADALTECANNCTVLVATGQQRVADVCHRVLSLDDSAERDPLLARI